MFHHGDLHEGERLTVDMQQTHYVQSKSFYEDIDGGDQETEMGCSVVSVQRFKSHKFTLYRIYQTMGLFGWSCGL